MIAAYRNMMGCWVFLSEGFSDKLAKHVVEKKATFKLGLICLEGGICPGRETCR